MAQCDRRQMKLLAVIMLFCIVAMPTAETRRPNDKLTACQHLRRAEFRRSKALTSATRAVRVPRCSKDGAFERIQCMNVKKDRDCWCVDEYGIELPGTRSQNKSATICAQPADCPAAACRMFCPFGFARDPVTNCTTCRCHDPCDGVECPNGQSCQLQEVKCRNEPCPPVPTCKKARSIANYCPAGLPLSIENSVRPFLCGTELGKPKCPPLYNCVVELGNDYGVCCPSALKFQKPGYCPKPEKARYSEVTGYMCGTPCAHDLECPNMDKCCFTKGCQFSCQKPHNVTSCHQAKAMSSVLAINEREGRGYVPDCSGPGGTFSPRQCSRNGLVCWCVDPQTGHKIKNTMGAAVNVSCDAWENLIGSRSSGRSMNAGQCDVNICAAVCEYGFKTDHDGCPTCECSEPCEGYKCPVASRCEVAFDPKCESSSKLCASWPVCKPDLAYSNPCEVGTPLTENATGEVMHCVEERVSRTFQPIAFFEPELKTREERSLNRLVCPKTHKCTKLHRQGESVCCPVPIEPVATDEGHRRQQTMCEYLRDFSERMEGTEADMQLAIAAPRCTKAGHYHERQCTMKTISVTRSEQRKILEENTIRRMRMLLSNAAPSKRFKRGVKPLKLYRVDDNALKVQLASQVMERSAKVIDMGVGLRSPAQLFENELKKTATVPKKHANDKELVELQVEECWCVDNFGTEIPRSRGHNVTDETCSQLRQDIDCLDLTCRMGCEYGFTLDPESRCPACQCRDPCDGVTCVSGKECRVVDVSCDDEYCSPVPACLPRKPGQCPYLVPPGSEGQESNTCNYECRTDSHCEGARRCCSNGCGTQCVEPQMKTACQHLHSIQMHQSSELGIPARKMYVAQCEASTGQWQQVQCGPNDYCWCVDVRGQEVSGTRVKDIAPVCVANSAFNCAETKCSKRCEGGYKADSNGCLTCECRDFCALLSCSSDEECQLISVECIDKPCPKMPICVPRRESTCPEGSPWKQGDVEVSCGPHNENEVCPTTHTCQLNPVSSRGVCCTKTRDVCFESIQNECFANGTSKRNVTRYHFSPKANKCIRETLDLSVGICHTKNLFHSELACNSVCPVLTQCERLKLKNSLVAQRSSQPAVWFQPRCDPISGHWSPVQCLGRQIKQEIPTPASQKTSRAFELGPSQLELDPQMANSAYGVCWCADKKGAPLKGTLTRDTKPVCNSRQARGRSVSESESHPLMEQLIRQITMLVDVDNFLQDADFQIPEHNELRENMPVESQTEMMPVSVTERALELANSLLDSQLSVDSTLNPLDVLTTRCRAMAKTAPFAVACDEEGGFLPTQCNTEMCWCVDAAGNQLAATTTFPFGAKNCESTAIASVAIELHMENQTSKAVPNVYDLIRTELQQLLGDALENLRVQENSDGSVAVRFELHNDAKVDLAFAIETAISEGRFQLGRGYFRPEITRSHFVQRVDSQRPVTLASMSPESTIHLVVFIMATSSAFLVSIFVVYIMLKRGKQKAMPTYSYGEYPQNKILGSGDKALDYTSPIFILNSVPSEHHTSSNVVQPAAENTTK